LTQNDETELVFHKGRGAVSNAEGRFARQTSSDFDDGWDTLSETAAKVTTHVTVEHSKTIISRNTSPDVPFDQSVNPYRGCEHGCVYCFARPSHSWLDLSPGLDFETRLFAKQNAATLLTAELGKKNYQPKTIALGVNTDAYQPVERQWKITRQILEVLQAHRHPVSIVTKSALIERDIDILGDMARDNLCSVIISVTTLEKHLCTIMEPRAAAPKRRLKTIETLRAAGIPTGILFAPAIPFINDNELESVVAAAADHGALSASYVLLRLPHELKELWAQWLAQHYPDRAARVMKIIRLMRDGADYQADFKTRMTGTGEFAELLNTRFKLALRKHGLKPGSRNHNTAVFRKPNKRQPDLFDSSYD